MRPPCHNRPPRAEGSWEPTGRTSYGIDHTKVFRVRGLKRKPVYRWRPTAFEDRCATWDGRGIGPNGEPYPQAHGWDCSGCRWLPQEQRAQQQEAALKDRVTFDVLSDLCDELDEAVGVPAAMLGGMDLTGKRYPPVIVESTPTGGFGHWSRRNWTEQANWAIKQLAKPPPSFLLDDTKAVPTVAYGYTSPPARTPDDPWGFFKVAEAPTYPMLNRVVDLCRKHGFTPVRTLAQPSTAEVTATDIIERRRDAEARARARFLDFPEELGVEIDRHFRNTPITADSKL